jgi:hypothetical protein
MAVRVFSILDIEPQEVAQLRSRIDLGLPCIFTLSYHCGCHDFIPVLGRDEIGGLEKDRSTFSEWQ